MNQLAQRAAIATGLFFVSIQGGLCQKPDLHAGGASPSEIPNHVATTVTLPGYHLTGAKVVLDGPCILAASTASENRIVMSIRGNRSIDDTDEKCGITVKTLRGSAATWIVVDLTGQEEAARKKKAEANALANAKAYMARSGKKWTVHFADGNQETYSLLPSEELGVPIFTDTAGTQVKISVTEDSQAMILQDGCTYVGTLSQHRVEDGKSFGTCPHPGSWTASME
jgi:hypothetical protein